MSELLALETTCPRCNGEKGRFFCDVEENNGWANCPRCNGSGFVPTPMGKQILDLIQHNSTVAVTAQFCIAGT